MFWKKKKDKSEKEWYIKQLAGTDPCNVKREEILKTMTIDQLKEVTKIVEEIRKRGTTGECKNCHKMNAAMRIYSYFEWSPINETPFTLGFDPKTNTIMVSEEMLMYFVQLANPGQQKREIKLFKAFEGVFD